MSREYDIYLDGDGYMLGRRSDGQLLSGAAREQAVDPFTNYVGSEGRWAKAFFRFGEGAGLAEYDGSHRYKCGEFIDTRGGKLLAGPERRLCDARGAAPTERRVENADVVADVEVSTGNNIGYGERFVVPAGKTGIRSVAVLVKRDPDTDYTGAADFQVRIYDDAAGPVPNAVQGTANMSPVVEDDDNVWLPFPDRWRNGEYFWLECVFATEITVTPASYYWIVIENNQAPEVYWAEDLGVGGETRSHYTAGAWVNGYTDDPLYFKVKYADEIDAFPRCFCQYRGADDVERMFAGVGYKVMYWDEAAGEWENSVTWAGATEKMLHLLEFNSRMFAARQNGANLYYYDGTTETTVWTDAGVEANALALHDNLLWKADGRTVMGSATGLNGAWTANSIDVGDPGTRVQAMVSHGGQLYAAKPEGIFEIDYPDTYPGSGTPTANLMLDFRTERSGRPWMLDWHSGLYFPGLAGVYELKSGVLRNIWTEKVDEGAQEIVPASSIYTKLRRWGPLYDGQPGAWLGAHGNTRGMTFAYCSPHLEPADVWWYDGSYWHEMGPGFAVASGTEREWAEYILATFVEDRGGGKGRLWYGYGANVGYWNVPLWTLDRSKDDDVDYEDADWLPNCYLPDLLVDEGQAEVDYYAVGVKTRNGGVAAGGQVRVYYSIDGGTQANLGIFDEDYEEQLFPADTRGRRIELQVVLDPENDNDITVEWVALMYQPLPDTVRTFQVIVTVADDVEKKNGSPDRTRSAEDLAIALEALLEEAEPWTYEDVRGVDHTVRAMGVTVQEMRLMKKPGPEGYRFESQAVVTMLEVA